MGEIDILLEADLYEDALKYLQTNPVKNRANYLFYLGYVQIHLGWTEEAVQNLTQLQIEYPGDIREGTVTGFLADIYHHNGRICEAVSEITRAMEIEPDCLLIQAKAEQIYSDFNDFLTGLTILYLAAQYYWMTDFR